MSSGSDRGQEKENVVAIKANNVATAEAPNGVRFPDRKYESDWTRTLDAFEITAPLGEGTFGWVQKGRDRQTGEIVALKKIKMEAEKEGFPITAIREIKILKTLRDRQKTNNVVVLKEVVAAPETDTTDDKGSIYLVFEYMDHDLAGLMDLRYDTIFKPERIKCYMKQLMQGLFDLHSNKIIHRDIKASNLLVNNSGILKIADFGLARPQCNEPYPYTSNVITLWYRPPELLLCGEKKRRTVYSAHVDIWSAGCILAEMLFRRPLFRGKTELELLEQIFMVLGTPTPQSAPELMALEEWKTFKPTKTYPHKLKDMCVEAKLPTVTYEFLNSLLAYDPSKRPSAASSLDHDFFWTDPLPCAPQEIPPCPSSHEFTAKKEKEKVRMNQGHQPHPGVPPHQPPPGHRGPYPPPGAQLPRHGQYPQGSYHPQHHHPGSSHHYQPHNRPNPPPHHSSSLHHHPVGRPPYPHQPSQPHPSHGHPPSSNPPPGQRPPPPSSHPNGSSSQAKRPPPPPGQPLPPPPSSHPQAASSSIHKQPPVGQPLPHGSTYGQIGSGSVHKPPPPAQPHPHGSMPGQVAPVPVNKPPPPAQPHPHGSMHGQVAPVHVNKPPPPGQPHPHVPMHGQVAPTPVAPIVNKPPPPAQPHPHGQHNPNPPSEPRPAAPYRPAPSSLSQNGPHPGDQSGNYKSAQDNPNKRIKTDEASGSASNHPPSSSSS